MKDTYITRFQTIKSGSILYFIEVESHFSEESVSRRDTSFVQTVGQGEEGLVTVLCGQGLMGMKLGPIPEQAIPDTA